jgi:hypothetical protein
MKVETGARAGLLLEGDAVPWQRAGVMNAQEVLATVAAMRSEEWMKIQPGIAEMLAARFSTEETSVIREALSEAEAEFARGDVLREGDVRRHFGLP